MLEHALDLGSRTRRVDSSAGNSCSAKKADLARLWSSLKLTAGDLAQKEQPPNVERMRPSVRVPSTVPHGGELVGTHLKTGLLAHFPGDGLGRTLVHVRPPARQRPAVLVCRLTNEQYPVVAEHRSTHAELRRGVTGLLS